MTSQIIRIEKIKLSLNAQESALKEKASKMLSLSLKEVVKFSIIKKAIDARDKTKIMFVYSVDIEVKDHQKAIKIMNEMKSYKYKKQSTKHNIQIIEQYIYKIKKVGAKINKDKNNENKKNSRPIIVGTGPAGLFAGLVLAKTGLNPLLIERGKDVDTRSQDVDKFLLTGKLNPNSNIQFGEGGAGTFSDGKLYTLINDPRSKFIFEEFIKAGAPKEIIYDAKPHIGTDKLKTIVKNLRKKIISLGGEIRFNSCLTDIKIENNNSKIISIIINNTETIATNKLILAIGHSARDTYEMLYKKKLEFQQKPFAIGVRIEHKASMINESQFAGSCIQTKLPTASYRLAHHNKNNRSVYSFCMCPGGHIIPASSEEGKLTINGMSEYKQDNSLSNSALLVGIKTSDFESDHPLAGIAFQRKREEKAFIAGGKNYNAPAQFVGDFINNKTSENPENKTIISSYKPGITLTSLTKCLPTYVTEAIKEALPEFDKKIKGFANPDTLLIGIESRSSSVVRIVRNEFLQSNIAGIYPTGEGAGYAGGITSAAIDGLKVAEQIIKDFN